MRLYPRSGATVITHAGEQYEAGEDGGFEFPPHVADALASFPDWETQLDRHVREHGAEQERKRDPASQYDEVAALRAEVEGLREDLRSLRDDLVPDGKAGPSKAKPAARKPAASS